MSVSRFVALQGCFRAAVGQDSGDLVSDDSAFTARATSEPPTVTLPNAGGRTPLVFWVIAGLGLLAAGTIYGINKKELGKLKAFK